jgi:outer membrane protein TolC
VLPASASLPTALGTRSDLLRTLARLSGVDRDLIERLCEADLQRARQAIERLTGTEAR